MKIERTEDWSAGYGRTYAFLIRNAYNHIVWSGHGFVTERSRDQAAEVALANLGIGPHPMVRGSVAR